MRCMHFSVKYIPECDIHMCTMYRMFAIIEHKIAVDAAVYATICYQ